MNRRDFVAALAASAIAAKLPLHAQEPAGGPRLLITPSDPFTGLHVLKSRYAAGRRPSEDMEGWALSWLLTGQKDFAERALTEMRKGSITNKGKASQNWVPYTRWALAFDWLYDYPGFDRALKDRITKELQEGAAKMLATPDFKDPSQYTYHNYALRYLALAAFASIAVERNGGCDARCKSWQDTVQRCFANVLDLTDFVTPDGSYHESMDYMRITWASLVLLAELNRTARGVDPAFHYSVFRNIGPTYLYKLLPDGTPSREGDNEYPVLDNRDTLLLGYAVNRFKDPYAAWHLRNSGFFVKQWLIPVLEFLWDDPDVTPRNPAESTEGELSRQKYFAGVGHLVMRNGWKPDSTWIEYDCGPYLAKHQHLDQNQFTIYHKGYLAIDSGADYTDTESPHYLNYYRRTVAHNSMLVYDPAEKFFWSDNVVPAENDGGQRMNSSRYWNTVRNREDFARTRDLWDIGTMRVIDHEPGVYHYALGDASRAYSSSKLRTFTRELLYVPGSNALFVFDRVVSADPSFRKAWLLHGVNQPSVDQDSGGEIREFANAQTFRFVDGGGELFVHSLLPEKRTITRHGGPGDEFYTPGNDAGGTWGTGKNWPMENPAGEPLPDDPKYRRMWKLFWGEDFDRILPSNRKNVVPGAWRIEVSPTDPAEEDLFLHVLEIGDKGATGKNRVVLLNGSSVKGAAFEHGSAVLFASGGSPLHEAEVSLPDTACSSLIIVGLHPNAAYEISLNGLNIATPSATVLPGVSAGVFQVRANEKGILRLERADLRNLRLRLSLIGASGAQIKAK